MKQPFRDPFIAAFVASLLASDAVSAQPLRPASLAEMPPHSRVLAEINGKDAEDTGERQMGAFMALIQLMDDMAWGLEHRYVNNSDTRQLTPDESRIRVAEKKDYADLWHKVTNKEGHVYDHDRDLLNEILKKFFSENFRALYFKSNAKAAAGYKAFHERMYSRRANPASTETGAQTAAPGSKTELRRCIASGRSMRICFTEVMGNAAEQLMGGSLKEPIPTGLRMTGDYASASGFRLIFETELATMVCRGVPESMPYAGQITQNQALITIQHAYKPVVFSLGTDGRLTGSGPIRVTGQVARGSPTEPTIGTTAKRRTTTREMTPPRPRNYLTATENDQRYSVQESATEWVYGPSGSRYQPLSISTT